MNLLQEINQNLDLFIEEAENLLNGLSRSLLENFDWEPQPEWRGASTETRDTGPGLQQSRQQEAKAKIDKIRAAYAKATRSLQNADPLQKPAIQKVIAQLEALAKQYNVSLTSPNERPLGLAPN